MAAASPLRARSMSAQGALPTSRRASIARKVLGAMLERVVGQLRTTNADQWRVGRELRMRLQERFATEDIRIPVMVTPAAVGPS